MSDATEETNEPETKVPEWVSFKDAADVLGMSERNLRRWASKRKIAVRKRGGHAQVDLASVDPGESEDADLVQAATELVRETKTREIAFFELCKSIMQQTTDNLLAENTAVRAALRETEKDLRRATKIVEDSHASMLATEVAAESERASEARKDQGMTALMLLAANKLGVPPEVMTAAFSVGTEPKPEALETPPS